MSVIEMVVVLIVFAGTVAWQQHTRKSITTPSKRGFKNISTQQYSNKDDHFSDHEAPFVPGKAANVRAEEGKNSLVAKSKAPLSSTRDEPHVLITLIRKRRIDELPLHLDAAYNRGLSRGLDEQALSASVQSDLVTVLRTCLTVQQPGAAILAYDHMASRVGDGCRDLWSLLLYSAVEASAFDRCSEFYQHLQAIATPSPNDVVNAMRALARKQDLAGLEAMLADLRATQCKLSTVDQNKCLAACCAEGAFDLARAIMTSSLFGSSCDAAGYNTVMRALLHRHKSKLCFELFGEMRRRGVAPTDITVSIVMEACVKSEDLERAKVTFNDIVKSGHKPNRVHYTTMVKGLVRDGQLEEASAMLHEMESCPEIGLDLIAYQSLTKAFADRGDVHMAVQILEQASRKGIQPDGHMFKTVLYACAITPRSSTEVLRIFSLLVDHGMRPGTPEITVLLKALEASKNWPVMIKFIEEAPKRFGVKLESRLYGQLGLACLKADNYDMAGKVLEVVIDSMGSRAVAESASTVLLQDCLSSGNLADAKAVALGSYAVTFQRLHASANERASTVTPWSASKARLAQFVSVNELDARCASLMGSLLPQQSEWVMDREFIVTVDSSRGTACAKIVALAMRAKRMSVQWDEYPSAQDLSQRLQDFITLNSLDKATANELSILPTESQRWLMDRDFLVRDEPLPEGGVTAKVLALVKQARDLRRHGAAFSSMVEDFVTLNGLDDRCAKTVRTLPRSDVASLIDQEGLRLSIDRSKGSASAKVVGMITRIRAGDIR